MFKISYTFLILFLILSSGNLKAQERFDILETRLIQLADTNKGLNHKVEISVNSTEIREFLNGLAEANNINLSIDPNLNTLVNANFSNVTMREVLIYLCKRYDLDLDFIGSVIFIKKFTPLYKSKELGIKYQNENKILSLDLSNDSLYLVARKITDLTGRNIFYPNAISGKLLNGYVQNTFINHALEKLALINELKLTITDDSSFALEVPEISVQQISSPKSDRSSSKFQRSGVNSSNFNINEEGKIDIEVSNMPIEDIIPAVCSRLHYNYFFINDIHGNASVNLQNTTFEELLDNIFNGTDYSYKKRDSIFFIGQKDNEGIKGNHLIRLRYRTVEKVTDYIPENLKKGLEIKLFSDQNGIVVNGPDPLVRRLQEFINMIDNIVPVIAIEVLIVDVRDSKTLSTGIEAGLGDNPDIKTSGTVYPNFNMTLNSNSINNLIDGINGFGSINLGKVTPNFYIKLKALDEQGKLDLRSTPRLATLNGHEATLSIGKTEYYLEVSNNVIGSQNPQNIITQQYKSVNADLAIKINPLVSGDGQITLDISVKQSSFTERISPSAPPGTITRDFKSLIRVKNEDMIVLGGLEEYSTEDNGSGIPFLSRIPIIKWLFSSRTRTKSKNRLTIFIKPTVLY